MGERYADLFQALRSDVLDRLVEVRGSIDQAYEGISDDLVRPQFDVVLGKMHSYLATGDVEQYRSFAKRWIAMRTGEGFATENLIHSMVAIADVVVQVAQRRMGQTPEAIAFAHTVVNMNFVAVRMLVENLAEDLATRTAQYAQLAEEPR